MTSEACVLQPGIHTAATPATTAEMGNNDAREAQSRTDDREGRGIGPRTVEGMQQCVARAVRGAGAAVRLSVLAVVEGLPAEGALVDLALQGEGETVSVASEEPAPPRNYSGIVHRDTAAQRLASLQPPSGGQQTRRRAAAVVRTQTPRPRHTAVRTVGRTLSSREKGRP